MAKSGKKPTETKPVEAKEEAKKNGAFLNRYPESLLTERTSTKDGKENKFFSVRVNTTKSKDGWGSFPVNEAQVFDCKDKDGKVVEGYKNILLSSDKDAEKPRTYKLNVCTKINSKGEKTYGEVEATFDEIIKDVTDHRKEYKKAQKAAEREDAAADIEAAGAEAEEQLEG